MNINILYYYFSNAEKQKFNLFQCLKVIHSNKNLF
jgi:hypothetical protein